MLQHIRGWIQGRLGATRPDTPEQSQDRARLKRETRAHTVTDLQAAVRDLQQQITDLTAADELASQASNGAKVAELEQQLAETQAELARYQGRI